MTAPLVIGLGQPFRGDDGIGPAVVERLAGVCEGQADFKTCNGDAAVMLDLFEGRQRVFVIDAVASDRDAPGTVHEVDAVSEDLPVDSSQASSHVLGLNDALALGRLLGKLPPELTIYGIVGASFDTGAEISGEVAAAIDGVVAAIRGKLDN